VSNNWKQYLDEDYEDTPPPKFEKFKPKPKFEDDKRKDRPMVEKQKTK
jgi:hypothetical protein